MPDLIAIYQQLADNSGLNTHQISLKTGLDLTTLRKIRRGNPTVTLRTLAKFIHAFGADFTIALNQPES